MRSMAGFDASQPLVDTEGDNTDTEGNNTVKYVCIGTFVLLCALAWPVAVLVAPGIGFFLVVKYIYFVPDDKGVARKDTNKNEALVVAMTLSLLYIGFSVFFLNVTYPAFCPTSDGLPCKISNCIFWCFDLMNYLSCLMSGDGGRNTHKSCSHLLK
eukprot:TRINITY_DN3119_c0_g1_i1.p1 TRINITY_DN3119_c0_g1~~TRINITY_DN3119_c0_g1_i1.p1  ORF type:complete len:156 (+),score=21.27 TRINITY_DN3119_c0_g1_i1:404-871(+)